MKRNINTKVLLGNTVDKNIFFTHQQFKKAKKARELYHTFGPPPIQDVKSIIKINAIASSPVTTDNINIAEQILGANIGS